MRVRPGIALAALFIAGAACSPSGPPPAPALDAGPPPHPLEFEFEGLALGSTKEAVVDAWGPPSAETRGTIEYVNRGAFASVQLVFKSVPVSGNIQPEAVRDAADPRPFEFLKAIILTPAERRDKGQLRPQLVALYGEPLADLAAAEPRPCEFFRAGECALLRVEWEAAPQEGGERESAASLAYLLAPEVLITEAPRTLWPSLRGAVTPSPPSDLGSRMGKLRTAGPASRLDEVLLVMGPPNLVIEDGPGARSLLYLWLNNAFVKLSLSGDALRSISAS
jgi:hypothetical protein